MGFFNNIIQKVNDNKFKSLKREYLKRADEYGMLTDYNKIQTFIAKGKIQLLRSGNRYNDEFDDIECVFSEEHKILKLIKEKRLSKVLSDVKAVSSIYTNKDKIKNILATEEYEQLKESSSNFACHYNINSNLDDFKDNLQEKYEITLNGAKNMSKKLKDIMADDYNFKEINNILLESVVEYSLSMIENTDEFSQKNDILNKGLEISNEIEKNHENDNDQHNKVSSKDRIINMMYSSQDENTLNFIKKIEQVKNLNQLGVTASLDDSNISYIDASNKEKNDKFYYNLKEKKQKLLKDNKEFNENDFMLVRTTEEFPIDKECKIMNEDNCRFKTNCFLTSNITDKLMVEKYGNNWMQMLHSEDEDVLAHHRDMIQEKFKILTTGYKGTKHFTLNKLVASHMYGNFENRGYIILDQLNKHIDDKKLINLNESDTYFQLSEDTPLKLSDESQLMIPLNEYLKIQDDTEMQKQLKQYKDITIFIGDEEVAVDMKLNELGYISESIGMWGYESYNNEFGEKLDKSVLDIAKEREIQCSIHYGSKENLADDEICKKMYLDTQAKFEQYFFDEVDIDDEVKRNLLEKIDYLKQNDSELDNVIDKALDMVEIEKIEGIINRFNTDVVKDLEANKKQKIEKGGKYTNGRER